MTNVKEFELLNDTTNAVVVRYIERNYPGLLIQGDTLKTFLDDVNELHIDAINGDLESVKDISSILQEKLIGLLVHYENIIEEHGYELPYIESVRSL